MTKEHQIQSILDGWREEYGITQFIWFIGWKDMKENGLNVLGRCWLSQLGCDIALGDKFKDRPLGWLETSILWHEFCHANAFLEDGVPDGHNKHWKKYLTRKQKYYWGEMVAKFVYQFL